MVGPYIYHGTGEPLENRMKWRREERRNPQEVAAKPSVSSISSMFKLSTVFRPFFMSISSLMKEIQCCVSVRPSFFLLICLLSICLFVVLYVHLYVGFLKF